MSQDLKRLESDLFTVRNAAGLNPPTDRLDVWMARTMVVGGVVVLLWALAPHGLPIWMGLLPFIPLAVIYLSAMHLRKGVTFSERSRRASTTWAIALAVAGAVLFKGWTRSLHIAPLTASGVLLFGVGLGLALPRAGEPVRWRDRVVPLCLMATGLALPLPAEAPFVALGICFMLVGLIDAMRLARSMREAQDGLAH